LRGLLRQSSRPATVVCLAMAVAVAAVDGAPVVNKGRESGTSAGAKPTAAEKSTGRRALFNGLLRGGAAHLAQHLKALGAHGARQRHAGNGIKTRLLLLLLLLLLLVLLLLLLLSTRHLWLLRPRVPALLQRLRLRLLRPMLGQRLRDGIR